MVVEMDDATREQVTEMFKALESDVKMHVFVKEHDCLYCNDTLSLAELVADLSEKIHLEVHKGELNKGLPAKLGVKHAPAIVLHGKAEYKIRFYGIPAGHEFGALISSIIDVSKGVVPLPPEIVDDISSVEKPIHIRVFTTPQCPYCPAMVRLANQAAIVNPLIESDAIESLEFQQLTSKYQVYGVPKTIFNETVTVEGLTPPEVFVEKLFDAVEK